MCARGVGARLRRGARGSGARLVTRDVEVCPVRDDQRSAHPYIPTSIPDVRAAMLDAVDAASVEDFYAGVPDEIRLKRQLDLPTPLPAESDLVRHMQALLARNTSTRDVISGGRP